MNITAVLNIATLAVSLAAVVVTSFLTLWQIRLSRGGHHLPVILDVFKDTHSTEWNRAQKYITNQLASDCPCNCGILGLPELALSHATLIGHFYDDLGKLVAHGVINQSLVTGAYGLSAVELWDTLAPYVYEERTLRGYPFWVYFEDLAVRIARNPPEQVYAKLNLELRPPST